MPRFIGRYQARVEGKPRYFTGRPCGKGHIAERRVSDTNCIECANEKTKTWKRRNRDKLNAQKRQYYERNKDKLRAKARERWHRRYSPNRPDAVTSQ